MLARTVRMRVCACVWIAIGERGHAVLSIKMPALCFHTVEKQAGPIVEDMAPYCRPDQRPGAARINKD